MRILFVAPRFHTNQVPLVRALQSAGHKVAFDVLVRGASEDHTVLEPNVVPLSVWSRWWFRIRRPVNAVTHHADHSFPSIAWSWRRLRRWRPDVVVIRDPNRPFSALTAMLARLLGIRLLLYTLGPVHAAYDRRKAVLRSLLLTVLNADWYSPVRGARDQPRVHPRVHYIPFAADLERSPKSVWFEGDAVNVLVIGKFVANKNHLLMLRVLDRVVHEHPARRIRLTIVGEITTEEHRAYHAKVVDLIRQLGLGDVVEIRSNLQFHEMAPLYLHHDLFVLPSRDEPGGISVLEAMAHGLPVICSTTCGAQWYVAEGRSGWVFQSDDDKDLEAKLRAAVLEPRRLCRMGEEARRLAETFHAPGAVAHRFERLAKGTVPDADGDSLASAP